MPRDGPDIPFADMERLRRRKRLWRWLERLLIVVGVLCLGYFLYGYGEARLYQSFEDQQLDAILQDGAPAEGRAAAPRRPAPAPGSTIGRIEIPRLKVSAVIRAGSDARTLGATVKLHGVTRELQVPVEIVPLAQAADCHRRILDRELTGKLVIDTRA